MSPIYDHIDRTLDHLAELAVNAIPSDQRQRLANAIQQGHQADVGSNRLPNGNRQPTLAATVRIETPSQFIPRRYVKIGEQLVGHTHLNLEDNAVLTDVPTARDHDDDQPRSHTYQRLADANDGARRRWEYLIQAAISDGQDQQSELSWTKEALDEAPW